MAPVVTSPKAIVMSKNGSRLRKSRSREVTPQAEKRAKPKSDVELASAFKSDLIDIRNLTTCSICDQLLYEPWTLGCGHTYCYSCLCNWFKDKRKKTCPECRNIVKQMPAPAFLIKQMVEIFIKRGELLPSDESIEQHQNRRAEEIADVDKDRNGPEGLFKGMFPAARRELIFDDGDGVYRCPRCLTEHEGGPTCANCDLLVESGLDFSDMEDDFPDDLEDLEADLDDDLGMPVPPGEFHFLQEHIHHHHFHNGHLHALHHHHYHHEDDSETSNSDSEQDDEDDDDDRGSIDDFVVPDDEAPQVLSERRINPTNERDPINISDDDSDEGGAISNGRRRRAITQYISSGDSSISRSSGNSVSSVGPSDDDQRRLQRAGWSPLDQENESDIEGHHPYPHYGLGDRTSDGSDTETIGNGGSDDGSERSETPRYEYPMYHAESSDDGEEDDNSEAEAGMDRDGDTEMSVSPSAGHYRSSSVSSNEFGHEMGFGNRSRGGSQANETHGYGDGEMSSRSASVNSENYNRPAQDLGEANEVHEVDDDSSDSSIIAPSQRRRRQNPNIIRTQQPYYDPRISMIFAEHQQRRGAQEPHTNLAQLDDQMRRAPIIEPASRLRRLNAYRSQPQRRADPLRSSRSTSATRIISSSNRGGRLPPQYQRRN